MHVVREQASAMRQHCRRSIHPAFPDQAGRLRTHFLAGRSMRLHGAPVVRLVDLGLMSRLHG